MSLLDPTWQYNRDTDVARTWRRHGWKPTTNAERRARKAGHGIAVTVIEAPELRPEHVTRFAAKLRTVGGRR